MRSNQLLYLLYGDKASYRHEAKFSILSALRHRRDAHSFTVTVMTDQPAEFAGWPVDVVPLDAQTLAAWVGAGGYHHRRKACAIQAGAQLAETTIFIDTDTVFVKDPAALFGRVSEDRFLMDEFEMLWAEASQRNEYEAFALELAQYNQLPVPGLRLFNSGVCGLTRSNAHLFADVIALIDRWAHHGQMLFTLEQVVVSMVLRDKKVVEANDCVHHYYAVKRFYHAMLEVFFERHGEVFRDELLGLSDQVPNRLPRNSLADRLRMKWEHKALCLSWRVSVALVGESPGGTQGAGGGASLSECAQIVLAAGSRVFGLRSRKECSGVGVAFNAFWVFCAMVPVCSVLNEKGPCLLACSFWALCAGDKGSKADKFQPVETVANGKVVRTAS
ncbi:hypothetical protein D3C79_620260 [compost metagenome]